MDGTMQSIVYAVVIAGLIYIVKKASSLIAEKIDAAKKDSRVMDQMLAKVGLETAEAAIKTVTEATVGKLEEAAAKDIRQKIKNGEAETADLKALAGVAYDEIMETVKPELIASLSKSLNGVEAYIKNQVEHQLGLLKKI